MDMALEKNRLLQRDAEWAAAAYEGRDIERIVSYWTEDAIVVPPNFATLIGKEAIRQYVLGGMQIAGFKISWTSTDATFSPDGRLAYIYCLNKVVMDGEDGVPITIHGRVITIWRKDSDGEWRCAVDIWNDAP